MDIERFLKYQNKTSDILRNKGFFAPRVPQVNVSTTTRNFEQWSELKVAKSPIVPVLSSDYKVPGF